MPTKTHEIVDESLLSILAGADLTETIFRRLLDLLPAAEEAIGKPVIMLIPEEHIDEEPAILERIRRGERVNHYETVRQRKDGTKINVSLTVSPLRPIGRVVGASKIARDITERKMQQQQQALLVREMKHRIKNTIATC